jgi:hypothetical protein
VELRRAIAIAAVFHATLFFLVSRVPRHSRLPRASASEASTASTPRPPAAPTEWEVALDTSFEPSTAASQPAASAARIDESRLPQAETPPQQPAAIARSPSADARIADAAESAATPAWTFSPTAPPRPDLAFRPSSTQASAASRGQSSTLDLDGAPAGATNGAGASGEGSGRTHSNILRDGLHAAEVAKGRAVGNPILGVARDVTMQQPSPVLGDVVFEARVDGSGHVVDVRVTKCDGDRSAWEAVRQGLIEAMRGRTVPIFAAASRGALVAFAIKSRWSLPSTHGPGVELGLPFLPGIKTSKGSKDPARVDILITPDRSVSVGTNLDPTDIGSSPLRTVTTRIVDETLL